MSVSVTVTRDFSLERLELVTPQDMRDLGEFAVRLIRTRTERGESVDGGGFRPYSERYAAWKQKALGHSRVDLTVSGDMLNAMRVTDATKDETTATATIGFVGQGFGGRGGTFIQRSRNIGAAQKAIYNDPSRPFFDLNETESNLLRERLDAAVDRRLRATQE